VKILFDECLPQRLRKHLQGHAVTTVPEAGWAGLKNGELVTRASNQFDVFITVDRNLSFQQNPSTLPIPVVVLHASSNKLADLEPLVPQLLKSLTPKLTKTTHHISG
jgi:hypothetical protein